MRMRRPNVLSGSMVVHHPRRRNAKLVNFVRGTREGEEWCPTVAYGADYFWLRLLPDKGALLLSVTRAMKKTSEGKFSTLVYRKLPRTEI